MLIKDAHDFDTFHPDTESTYRIITTPVRKDGRSEQYATSPFMVGISLHDNYSQVGGFTPFLRTFRADVNKNDHLINCQGLFTNNDFFKMFGFTLTEGDPKTALSDPYSVVLTKDLAQRLFKNEDAMGQELEMPAYDTKFKVTGVLDEFPGKTHLEFEALGSISTQIALDKSVEAAPVTESWTNYYQGYNFIKIKNEADKNAVVAALGDISKTRYEGLTLESRDKGYEFQLQALSDITPGPIMSNNMGNALPIQILWFFSILSIIVILSACFNYTNLSIARSLTRAREVGVRKVMGATRKQVFGQFISEAVVVSFLGLALGALLLQFLIPGFQSIQVFSESDITLAFDFKVVSSFVLFTFLIGLIAGILPATVLSKFSPLSIMQGLGNIKLFRKMGLRKTLIVFQFSISLIFILVLTIVWEQIDFAVGENFGSDRTDIVNISLNNQDFDIAATAFSQLPQVKKISGTSHLMGNWEDSSDDIRMSFEDEKIGVRDYFIDHNFLNNFEIELIAGENFPENRTQQQEVFAIVNEDFLRKFNLGDPSEALGQSVIIGDSNQVAIKGVVKDFLFKPLVYNLEPLLLRYDPARLSVMNLVVSDIDLDGTVAAMEQTWKQLEPDGELAYQFYDETVTETFLNVKGLAKVVGYFGTLGLFIASLGLLGMAIYTVETKAKEVSIRKVVGASVFDLVKLLSKGYALLLAISLLVAVPASFFIGKQLLQTFAFSVPMSIWMFVPGVLILTVLGMMTIGSQTVRGALANPVEKLRDD